MSWKTEGDAATYLPTLEDAERAHGIPTDLLSRIAYQESHWRADIVSGTTRSPAGAVGLMQLMPQDFPGAGVAWPTDVQTAAKLLSRLYAHFQDWQLAVAAYNDGQGNIQAYLDGSRTLPTETALYVKNVIADVPVAGLLVPLSVPA